MGKGSRLRAARRAGARCIFCGDPVGSQEHLWPDWLKHSKTVDHTSVNHDQVEIRTVILPGGTDAVLLADPRTHSGPPTKHRVPVVCAERCNNGWMSRLENQTKPLLLPLIDGESRHLDPSDQRTLARWADKTAVVLETTSPKTVVSSQADRTRIMQEEDDPAPAQFSRVWIGRTDLPARLPASRARSVRVRDVVTGEVGGVRSDVLIVGHVVLYVVGATFPDLASIPSAVVALNDKLAQIWPIAHRTFSWPSASALSSDDIETLVASIHEDY